MRALSPYRVPSVRYPRIHIAFLFVKRHLSSLSPLRDLAGARRPTIPLLAVLIRTAKMDWIVIL